ncbi:MBL fold metallo-hydrolase [Thermostaphylospora chromogena]|uniref:L-ascorbate metabolism protein UlaG, beta-lactamase superfamily n=1 Tax=Thermostaphylospora chromogena TaxID=35622 RepID=A0A1H1HQN9_9ACTN|nr:MBL fold metallo-hydrolase [Thermostaphylospora chromogena]SDR27723.1 L-ascorbate metabolism protein UlaG, beta-lactamase superfamily [Thermostaphylospora chromogena]
MPRSLRKVWPRSAAYDRKWYIAGVLAAGLAAGAWALRDVPAALGGVPTGDRLRRMRSSPRFDGTAFRNTEPDTKISAEAVRKIRRDLLLGDLRRAPAGAVPVLRPSFGDPRPRPDAAGRGTGELRATWLGHATTLVEIEGRTVLFDPVWSERCSPSRRIGPRRLHPVPLPLSELPRIDAVAISHDHYDHLDMATVRELTRTRAAPFLVPLGVGAHLERWGVPASRIVELDWEEHAEIAGLRITATAARHFSGRGLTRNPTLWSSWVVAGARRRVFYTGDSGYFPGYAAIGAAHGPFDLTLVQIGAYGPTWPDIHMTPEEAVTAHLDLRGRVMLPVHWCTFTLAFHAWDEPVERLWQEAKSRGVRLVVPRPGERVDVDDPPPADPWWRALT